MSARKFASTRVDVFEETVVDSIINDYSKKASIAEAGKLEEVQLEEESEQQSPEIVRKYAEKGFGH